MRGISSSASPVYIIRIKIVLGARFAGHLKAHYGCIYGPVGAAVGINQTPTSGRSAATEKASAAGVPW